MQGDNNPTEDFYKNGSILYVTEDNFYGSYVKTLNIFNLKSFGNGKGLLIFVLVVGASMLVIEGFSIANAIRDSKKEKEAPKIEILDDEELKKKLKEEIKKEILNGKDK